MKKISAVVAALRIKHYIKNLLVFVPFIFARDYYSIQNLFCTFLGFCSFCFISSAVYIVNDLKDIEKDKSHPSKKNRPFASGRLTKADGIVMEAFCLVLSFLPLLYVCIFKNVNFSAMVYLLLYFVLNILYSCGLKNVPVIDIFILMSGFLIRIFFGAVVAETFVSSWLCLTTMSASFFLGIGKRRGEINLGTETRNVLKKYNFNFLDKFMYVSLAMAIVFYALWAKEYTKKTMIITVPILVAIFMQYSLDIEGNSDGDPVEVVLGDKKLILFCLLFIITVGAILFLT